MGFMQADVAAGTKPCSINVAATVATVPCTTAAAAVLYHLVWRKVLRMGVRRLGCYGQNCCC